MPSPPARHCSGPACTGRILPSSPLPDFCCYACAHAWAQADHPTEPPQDGGAGEVAGLYFGASAGRNNGQNPVHHAFPWLDARPHPDDETTPS